MVGRTIGHYRLLEQVGQGGMAVVYRAKDLSLDRECAVKVLHPHLQGDKESRLRFQREAQAVARLRHENILEIYAYSPLSSEQGEDSFLVAEFIHGPTLRAQLLAHAPFFPEVGAMIGCEVARALAVAHREGIIHRDIKPENIMIRKDGTLVLCDFGIARILDKDTVTSTGQLLGSPAYMAPEHIRGLHVDSRSDLFSLGTLMYELCTGELPFRGKNPHETLTRIAAAVHTPVGELAPLCSTTFNQIIERALSQNPEDRYQDADLLRADLLQALHESDIADVRSELSAYFRDAAAWEAAYKPRLLARLIAHGRELRRKGRVAAALSVLGRAQQLDPEHKEVKALLDSLARGHRRRRILVSLVALAAVCCGVLLARPHLLKRPAPSQPIAKPVATMTEDSGWRAPADFALPFVEKPQNPPATPPSPALASEPPALLPAAPTPADRPPPLRVRPAGPIVLPAAHVVRLEPWPKAVRVSHNGRLLGAYGTDVRTVQLTAGRNEFLFENPACYSERVVLPPGIAPEEVRVRLRWKPALLQVRAYSGQGDDTSGAGHEALTADVLVDGRLIGRSGQVLAVPISGDESSRAVEVQVSAPQKRTVSRTLKIHANQLSQIELSLSPL